jgi:Flp pilus assembly protein TadG
LRIVTSMEQCGNFPIAKGLGNLQMLRRASQRGQAAMEAALMLPWLVYCFIGCFDLGFASYSLISTQNAARTGAVWGAYSSANAASANFTSTACGYALDELRYAPGVGSGTTTCGGSSPVSVVASAVSGNDGQSAVSVTVTYALSLIVIPGILNKNLVLSRTVVLTVHG